MIISELQVSSLLLVNFLRPPVDIHLQNHDSFRQCNEGPQVSDRGTESLAATAAAESNGESDHRQARPCSISFLRQVFDIIT